MFKTYTINLDRKVEVVKSDDVVIYEKDGDIGRILLNRPQQRNALNLEVLKKLIEAFKQSEENGDSCVVFTSEGKDFTVGLDLKEAYSILKDPRRFEKFLEISESFQELTRVMAAHSGIIIAGLKGYVIGGGFEMTLLCDLRVASKDAVIMLPELSIGTMFSNASTKLLPRIVGEARAKEIFFLGERINAEKAYKLGLVNYIVEPEMLAEELNRMAKKIIEKDLFSLKIAKKLINENQDADMEAVLDRELLALITCSLSEGFKERVKAFVEKRETDSR
jgi:enoyl-CoA hydratase/carnithine racemase